MRRLGEILDRPVPAEWSLALFAAVAVILVVAAVVLMAIPGPSYETSDPDSASIETVPDTPDRTRELEVAAVESSRRFLSGYLQLTSGHGGRREVQSASRELRRRLERPMRIPPAARRRQPRLVEVESGPIIAGKATLTATVESGGITFPMILDVELIQGHWLVTRVGAE